jgi:hypothetical protein
VVCYSAKKFLNTSIKNIRFVGAFLVGVFFLFFLIGSYSDPIVIDLRKASIPKEKNTKKNELAPSKLKKAPSTSQKVEAPSKPIKTGGQEKILLVGDSQLEAMRNPFYNYVTINKHTLAATVLWYGSSSKQWANTDTLNYYIKKYNPTMVVLVLGLNELFVNDFDQRRKNLQKIKNQLTKAGINHYWIGPAAWKKDLGITGIMQEEWGNKFYPSHKLVLGRAKDNRHPSNDAAWVWMSAVAKETTKSGVLNLPVPISKKEKPKNSPFILLKVPK